MSASSPPLPPSQTPNPPTSAPDDDIQDNWTTWERSVLIKTHTVLKSTRPPSSLPRLPNSGKPLLPWWPQERLLNEAATLTFISPNTTIPVPAVRRLYTTDDGLLHLEMTRIRDGVLLLDVNPAARGAAVQAVEAQMEAEILPQLRGLRRGYIGSVDSTLPVFPPSRIYGLDRRVWLRITSAEGGQEFVFCHNDLAPQNIFVDPETFRIVGIIDWEFAGYFPKEFELPLWREFEWEGGKRMYDEVRGRDLGFFGLTERDLRDDRGVSPP